MRAQLIVVARRAFIAAGLLNATIAVPVLAQQPTLAFEDPAVWCVLTGSVGACDSASPMGLDLADVLDEDDLPEVAVVIPGYSPTAAVSVFRNTGDWSPATDGLVLDDTYEIDDPNDDVLAYDVRFADMDNDMALDLVVSLTHSPIGFGAIVILWNDGTGVFDTQTRFDLQSVEAYGLAVADLNNDGLKDVIVGGDMDPPGHTSLYPQIEILWRNSGSPPTFRSETIAALTLDSEINPGFGAAVDVGQIRQFVGDEPTPAGQPDVIMSMVGFDTEQQPVSRVMVLLNDGDTDNDTETDWTASLKPAVDSRGIDFGKLRPNTLDGRDVALADWLDHEARILKGDGLGGFSLIPTQYFTDPCWQPWGLMMGSIDSDTARNDVAIACEFGDIGDFRYGGVAIFQGRAPSGGDPRYWSTPRLFTVGSPSDLSPKPAPRFVRIANMDGTGLNDVVTSNHYDNSLSVLINED